MVEAATLISIMEKEKEILINIADASLMESKAIIQSNPTQLQECIQKKESFKENLDELERQRMSVAGGKRLLELLPEFKPEEQEMLRRLHLELKAGAREVQALRQANKLLYKQSIALLDQMQKIIGNDTGRLYSQSGAVAKDSSAGNFVSSLA